MILLCLVLALLPLDWNSNEFRNAVLHLSGAASVEELTESELERYQSLAVHPMDLNAASRSQLLATGFFTPFQVESILDYIRSNGDILSTAELAAVPGIGLQMARDLEFFFVMNSSGLLGASKKGSLYADAQMRQSVRSGKWTSALKASSTLDSRLSASLAVKNETLTSASVSYSGRTISRLVLGSFSARFGQGLLMWSGFSLSGLSTVSAFSRNSSGLAPCSTLSPESCFNGAAAAVDLGRSTISLAADFQGVQMLNLNHLWKRTSASLTAVHSPEGYRASADLRTTLGKCTLLGEGALDLVGGGTAALLGAVWNIAYGKKSALLLRAYSPSYSSPWAGAARSSTKVSNEYAASAGVQLPWISATADAAWHPSGGDWQYKGIVNLQHSWGALTPSLKISTRYRPQAEKENLRTDIRFDLDGSWGELQAHLRVNALRCVSWGWLGYAEAGWKGDASLWLRATVFDISSWADRIYVYERDVPGSFNVPAYYGKGYSLALFAAWKELRLRLATTRYPGGSKSPSWELKLMIGMKSQNLKPMLRPTAGE